MQIFLLTINLYLYTFIQLSVKESYEKKAKVKWIVDKKYIFSTWCQELLLRFLSLTKKTIWVIALPQSMNAYMEIEELKIENKNEVICDNTQSLNFSILLFSLRKEI